MSGPGLQLRRGLLALFVGLAGFTISACEGCSHHPKESSAVNDSALTSVLSTIPSTPRHALVVFESRVGSSQALVAAAAAMLYETGLVTTRGGGLFWYTEPASPTHFVVRAGLGFASTISLAQLQGLLQAIGERLAKSPGEARLPEEQRSSSSKILWVEGVHIQTSTLNLPHPELWQAPWAAEILMASVEDPFAKACEVGREDPALCQEMTKRAKEARVQNVYETGFDTSWSTELKSGEILSQASTALDRKEELYAVAVNAWVGTSAAREVLAAPAKNAFLKSAIEKRQAERKSPDVFPVAVTFPKESTSPEAHLLAWLDAVHHLSATQGVVPARGIVFEADDTHVRGAVLGVRSGSPPRDVVVGGREVDSPSASLRVTLEPAQGGAGEPRGWNLTLRSSWPLPSRRP